MCTGIRFVDADGNMYFGRNLDWTEGYGQKVYVTQRGYTHNAFMDGKTPSKYAVIGMALESDGFPLYFDCGNEEGLAVAGLNFPGYAQYEDKPVEGKVNVPAYAFPFYIASQFKTVDEAEEALKNLAITNVEFEGKFPVSLLHWIIGDKTRSIVVEYQADGMHVYHDDLDVLTNQPTFPYHEENVRSYISCTDEFPAPVTWDKKPMIPYGSGSGMRGIPGDYYSPSRFVRIAYLNSHYPVQSGEDANITRMFQTLAGNHMILGAAKVEGGQWEYTLYTGGYSAATKTYYACTYEDPSIRSYSMEKAGLDGGQVVLAG